jgi:hypothetical protein
MSLTKASVPVLDDSVTSKFGGFKNKIINGNFDIWQRGTTFLAPTNNGYSADRWINFSAGTSAILTRQAFSLDQTQVPGNPTYFARINVTSVTGAANHAVLDQRIEDVRTLAGQTATLSFWAKADAPKNIGICMVQSRRSGDVINDAIGATLIPLTTSWQKYTQTFQLPIISNTVMLTSNAHAITLQIYFDAGTSFASKSANLGHQSGVFDLAEIQLEEGSVATPFEQRPIGLELSLCQRYYEVGNTVQSLPASNDSNTGTYLGDNWSPVSPTHDVYHNFKVEKRVPPSITADLWVMGNGFVTASNGALSADPFYSAAFPLSSLGYTGTGTVNGRSRPWEPTNGIMLSGSSNVGYHYPIMTGIYGWVSALANHRARDHFIAGTRFDGQLFVPTASGSRQRLFDTAPWVFNWRAEAEL